MVSRHGVEWKRTEIPGEERFLQARKKRKKGGELERIDSRNEERERRGEKKILAIGIPSIGGDVDQLAPPIVYSADGATSTPPSNSFLANLIFIPND